MSLSIALALVLMLAALAASLRHARRWRRQPAHARPGAWRMGAILVLQFASAALLFATLQPPARTLDAARLVVMTAGTDAAEARAATRSGAVLVALAEAGDAAASAGARALPDLATALRLYPQAGRLHVLGAGLEARDLDAARALPVTFRPPPLPSGLVELHAPVRVASGGVLHVSGRVHDASRARLELLDPAGAVQDRAVPDGEGRFQLQAPVRASGPAVYRLRLRGEADAEAVVPVEAGPGDGLRLLLLAGAPNPELKYLRRWASDAGLQLRSRMALGGAASLDDGPLVLDARTLSGLDLVIVDERAWAGLGAETRAAVLAAVDRGLGLLLRITGTPDASTRDALRRLGFALGDSDPALAGGVVLEAADATVPALARQPHPLLAAGSVSLLEDASGASLARWRPSGRGRIAVWNLDQSFRLVLTGHGQRHAHLWSEAMATIARAAGQRTPRFEGIARAGGRATLCDFEPGTVVVGADGSRLHPLPDPASAGCGALWPERSGWHRIGEDPAAPLLYVHTADALPGLAALARRDAMLDLGGNRTDGGAQSPPGRITGAASRWPWFLAWLLAAGLAWWLERGLRHRAATARQA